MPLALLHIVHQLYYLSHFYALLCHQSFQNMTKYKLLLQGQSQKLLPNDLAIHHLRHEICIAAPVHRASGRESEGGSDSILDAEGGDRFCLSSRSLRLRSGLRRVCWLAQQQLRRVHRLALGRRHDWLLHAPSRDLSQLFNDLQPPE